MQVLYHHAAIYICSGGSVFLCVIVLEQDAIEASKRLDMQNSILWTLAPEHGD